MIMGVTEEMKRSFAREKLATRYYKRYCQHNDFEQWSVPPMWAYDYADDSLDVFDITDDVIDRLAGAE